MTVESDPRIEPLILLDLFPEQHGEDLEVMASGRLRDEVHTQPLSLTPVLGPECLDGGDDDPDGVRGPAGVVQKIYIVDLDQYIHQHRGPTDVAFLRDIKNGRRGGRREAARPADGPLAQELLALQLAVFDCALRSTVLYSQTWAKNPSPVSDWANHEVYLQDEDRSELIDLVAKAINASAPLRNEAVYLLGATSIELRLKSLREVLQSDGKLLSSAVEWLTDLFWHTVIFDSPCYPRVDELALQVSLVGSSRRRPIRRFDPSSTVDRGSIKEFHKAVTHSVHRGFAMVPVSEVRDGFHGALANVMHAQFLEWEHGKDRAGRHLPIPIAISTTFDLELERALATADLPNRRGGAYHVALPVVHVSGGQKRGKLRWVVGTFDVLTANQLAGLTEERLLHKLMHPDDEGWQWFDRFMPPIGTPELHGPLLLKVNGSPLHVVRTDVAEHPALMPPPGSSLDLRSEAKIFSQPDPSGPNPGKVFHAPAIAEFDVLQLTHVDEWAYGARQGDASIDQGLPDAVTKQLDNRSRYWLIAGQRLADWSSRMQIFLHVSRALLNESSLPSALAVSREFDRDRARLLDGLGIRRAAGDFEALRDTLNRIAADARNRGGRP